MRELGHRVDRQALCTGLRRHGRKALPPESFVPRTTDSTHGPRCAPDLLPDQLKPTQANRVWASDTIHLPLTNRAWTYLGAFQDVCIQHVVGWYVRVDMPGDLVISALHPALLAQRTRAEPDCPLRPRSYPVGRAVCGQCLQVPATRRPGPALAQPTWRMLRQHPGRKPLVAPENRGARSPRLTRVCRFSRRTGQRRRLFLLPQPRAPPLRYWLSEPVSVLSTATCYYRFVLSCLTGPPQLSTKAMETRNRAATW